MRLDIAAMRTRSIAPSKIGALLAIQPGQRSASRHTLPWCFEPEAQRKSDAANTAPDLSPTKGPGEEFQLAKSLYPGRAGKSVRKGISWDRPGPATCEARRYRNLVIHGNEPGE